MAIRYLDEPTTAQPQAAQPAGRIRYLDEETDSDPMDFSQLMQPFEPTVLPSEQPKPAPRKKVGGFLPIESRGLEEPHFFEEIEEFGPDVEQFLSVLPTASKEQLATIRSEIGKMPEKDRAALQDAVYMRHGRGAFGIAGMTTSPELVQRADPNKEINLAPGAAGAFGRAVIGSTGPTTGAIAGASAGSRVPGPPIVKIPATILGVLGGAYAGYKGQEFAENKLLGEERAATLARQRMADIEAQPGATFAGEVLPSMAFLRPNASGLKAAGELAKRLTGAQGKEAVLQTWRTSSPEARAYLINSAFGSGVDTTLQTIREAMREDGIDLAGVGRILAAAGIGASQVDPTRLGKGLGLRDTIELPAQRLTDVTPPKAPDATATRFDEDSRATAALREAIAQPEARLADIVPEETALAGIRDVAPEQVRTPIDDALAAPRPTTQVAPEAAPAVADEFGTHIPQWLKDKASKESGAIPEGATSVDAPKAKLIRVALKEPGVEWGYSHQNLKPDYAHESTQVDAFKDGENLVSTNPADLRAFGFDVPDLPPNTPQGKYSLEQAKALAAPRSAPTESAAAPRAAETAAPAPTPKAPSHPKQAASAVVAPGEAVVAPTAKKVAATAILAGDRRMKVQKEFLVDALKKAEKDSKPITFKDAEEEAAYQRKKNGAYGPKSVEQFRQYERELAARNGYVTIEVPDDGTFRVINEKNALAEFRAKVEKQFGRGLKQPSPSNRVPPKLTAEELNSYRMKPEEVAAFDAGQPRPATPEPVVETAPTPKPASPAADYTVKDWIADLDAGKKLEDLPNPSIRGMAELKLRDKRLKDLGSAGRINITPGATTLGGALVGGAGGAGYGITQGDTPEERLDNAMKYGFAGLAAGAGIGSSAGRAIGVTPIRRYKSPTLKKVVTMLTPKKQKADMFKFVKDAAGNFRLAFNTSYAKIGQAQRQLFKEAGRKFTPNRYYDLERQFEQIAGVPAKAEGEVELLQNILQKLPKDEAQHFDPYLVLARIEDRLVKTGEENARLLDAVGRAQAEVDIAQSKVAAARANVSVTVGGVAQKVAGENMNKAAAGLVAAKHRLKMANDKLNAEFDRKRVGDWSINEARKGLTDLEAEIGPQAFARVKQSAQEFQNVMRRALQLQVDSGKMSQGLMDRVLAENDFYAGFKVLKYFDDEEPFLRGGGVRRIPSNEQLTKKITGIDDTDVRIEHPFALAAEQVYKGKILAEKNILMRKLATLSQIDPDGKFVRLMKENEDPRKGYQAVTYFTKGQPRRMELSNDLAKAVEGLDKGEADILLAGLGKVSSVFKLGATGLSIPFNIANAFVFDPLRLATISRYGFRGPQDIAWTLVEWPKALWSSARGNIGSLVGVAPDELYNTWLRSGAAISTFARVMSPESFASRLPKDIKVGEAVMDKGLGVKPVLKLASLMSSTLEETTKLWGLQRAMRLERLDKLTPLQRARRWTEIVTELRNYTGSPDFARFGTVMRPLNIIMPFLNPRWQGFSSDFGRLNPFIRGNVGDSTAAWTRLLTLVGTSTAALAYYNLSNDKNAEDYSKIPQWEKDNYWNIPLNKGTDGEATILDTGEGYYFKNENGEDIRGYLRIPKREFPKLLANTVEDFMGYARGQSKETLASLAGNFVEDFAETASPINIEGEGAIERVSSAASGLNPAFRIPLEQIANKNFFTRRPIVPMGREDASPENQFEASTPQFYKDAAARLPDILPEPMRSPARLQHATESFTGGFVRQFVPPEVSEGNPAGSVAAPLRRFFRSERTEQGDLQEKAQAARRGRADQRITAQEEGGKLADAILAAPTREEKLKIITDARASGILTPEVEEQTKEELQDAQKGLTYEDRTVKRSFTVVGGFRAQYYFDKINTLPPEQRAAYIVEQKRKGILTPDVEKQLIAMFRQQQK